MNAGHRVLVKGNRSAKDSFSLHCVARAKKTSFGRAPHPNQVAALRRNKSEKICQRQGLSILECAVLKCEPVRYAYFCSHGLSIAT